jgi:integrase
VSLLAPTLQAFFTERLATQRHASPQTVAAYRDALRLLLDFVSRQTQTAPSKLDLADLDTPMIAAFLEHLERTRGNSPRTRNARLAAIHSPVPVRRAAPPRARRVHPACPGDPAKTLRPRPGLVPDQPGDPGAAGKPGSLHLDRPT